MKLHNFTLKYITIALLVVIGLWAFLFYAFILDEVYDNIDGGLKDTKIEIIKEAYNNPKVLKINRFGISNFKITPMPPGKYSSKNKLTTTTAYMWFDDEDEPIRLLTTFFYDKKGNPYKLEIKASMIEEDDLITDMSIALIVLYFMLVISIFIINYFVLKKAWKPFYILLNRLKNYSPGVNKIIPTQQKIKEFNDLQSGIEKMLKKNENVFNQQKLFIYNAAHELQTPLAISINKLELMAETEITEKQMSIISSVNDSLSRLVKLNKSLLLLTKIENNQFSEKETVNFNQLIKNSISDFSDFAEHKKVSVHVEEQGSFSIEMDKGLAIVLVNNLLKNAIVHNYITGKVNFIITNTYFLIQNTSEQCALDINLIFNRFYRQTTNNQSIGLGLSLVKTIVNSNNMSIDYYFDEMQNFKISKY